MSETVLGEASSWVVLRPCNVELMGQVRENGKAEKGQGADRSSLTSTSKKACKVLFHLYYCKRRLPKAYGAPNYLPLGSVFQSKQQDRQGA